MSKHGVTDPRRNTGAHWILQLASFDSVGNVEPVDDSLVGDSLVDTGKNGDGAYS